MKNIILSFRRSSSAFSLVEVVVALGIVSFALLAIIALLPLGIQSTKDSLDETGAVNVLSAVIADRQAAGFGTNSTIYSLPLLTNTMSLATNSFLVKDDNTATTILSQARYRVDYTIIPPSKNASTPLNDPFLIHFKVSWPPSTNAAGSVEAVVSFPQP